MRGQETTVAPDGKRASQTFADPTKLQKSIHTDDWNRYVIAADGPKLTHTINDPLMSETVDSEPEKRFDEGVIALPVHVGPSMTVRFRNICIEDLDPQPERETVD